MDTPGGSAVSRANMYSIEDDDTTSSASETTEDNVETVKPAPAAAGVSGTGQVATASSDKGLLQTLMSEPSTVVSKHEDDTSIGDDDEDIDEYFNDLFPGF